MYIYDINIFAKNDKRSGDPDRKINMYSQDIGIKLCFEKCAILIMKSSEKETKKEIEVPNHESV